MEGNATIHNYSDEEIMRHFPHDEARRGQLAAVRFCLESWDAGKRFVLLEAPTGAGKSAIGLALAGFYKNSFYLTIQKMLQSQIIRDYSRVDMVELKGRNAYPCTFYDLHAPTLLSRRAITLKTIESNASKDGVYQRNCDNGYCKVHLGRFKCVQCFPPKGDNDGGLYGNEYLDKYGVSYSTCPYYEQVGLAMASSKVLMNFSSFLYQTQYAQRFGQRDLMIIDEAHQCEPQLMDFVSLTLSDLQFNSRGIKFPEFDDPCEYAVWFHDHKIELEIGNLIKEARDSDNSKDEDEAVRLYHKYRRFMECISNGMVDWVCEYKVHSLSRPSSYKQDDKQDDKRRYNGKEFATVTIKPVFVNHFAESLLFGMGKKVLLMSATILDAGVMTRSLGIDQSDVAFFRMGNYFPKENRPIHIDTAAKMTGGKNAMGEWGPKLVKKVDEIVSKHKDDRGIIHTHNFAIAELILEKCRNRGRFLFQRNFKDKEEMLKRHAETPGSIIVAPAMHEGLDLKGDLSRFQIIAKVPYPNFFDDKQLGRRVEIDPQYLTWLVALKTVQSYGRSVRSPEDWAHTYIIDESIHKFMRDAGRMLPDWFKEAIVK